VRATLCVAAIACVAGATGFQQPPPPTFGTTVVDPAGLRGDIYLLPHSTLVLPDFRTLKPTGAVYTSTLNVPPQDFRAGFPGVTDRFEWFAIDYNGRFWIEKPGRYIFVLTSDDGARLYIDDQLIADNDGLHQSEDRVCSIRLAGGIHRIRVSYFQGPRFTVALVLRVAGPREQMRIFSTDEFKPPPNPENWRFPATDGGAPPTTDSTPDTDTTIPGYAPRLFSATDSPINLEFAGAAGDFPEGWYVPESLTRLGFTAQIHAQGCDRGPTCAVVLGNLMQRLNASRYRGQKVRLRASLRLAAEHEKSDQAQMWLRVDRANGNGVGFIDNMAERAVTSTNGLAAKSKAGSTMTLNSSPSVS
jgi:hypothetical protein